jgi:multidrug efflux pump subunit AcrB
VLTGLGYSAHRTSLLTIVLAMAIVVEYANRHQENDERLVEHPELCEELTKLAMREIIAPILDNARPALGLVPVALTPRVSGEPPSVCGHGGSFHAAASLRKRPGFLPHPAV